MTINECVSRNHTFCVDGGNYRMIPYFCGSAEMCTLPTEDGLKRAQDNVDRFFLVVGVLEKYEQFLNLTQKIIPKFFDGIVELYDKQKELAISGGRLGWRICWTI